MRFAATKDLNALIEVFLIYMIVIFNKIVQFIKKEYHQLEMGEAFTFQFHHCPFGCLELVFGPQNEPITGWTVSPDIVPCQVYG